MEITRLFKVTGPLLVVEFENPLYGRKSLKCSPLRPF